MQDQAGVVTVQGRAGVVLWKDGAVVVPVQGRAGVVCVQDLAGVVQQLAGVCEMYRVICRRLCAGDLGFHVTLSHSGAEEGAVADQQRLL